MKDTGPEPAMRPMPARPTTAPSRAARPGVAAPWPLVASLHARFRASLRAVLAGAVVLAFAGAAAPAAAAQEPDALAQALTAETTGQWAQARALYESALAAHPGDLELLLGLARVHQAEGRPWEAATLLEDALAARPDNVRLLHAAGDAVLANGSPAMALEHYDHALRLAPDDEGVRRAAAWACVLLRRGNRVVELLAAVPPERLPAVLQRAFGRAALVAGRPELAAAALAACVAALPDDVDAWLDLARARFLLGEDADALAAVGTALQLRPDSATALVIAGHVRLRNGQHDLARASYEEAIRLGADAAALEPLLQTLRASEGG
jgi:tetratricopeptide (TPR) repeat protein